MVCGDIGTSPLYALKQCFSEMSGLAPVQDNILGILSLTFWLLTLVVSIKYVLLVMRADNKGEGGTLALMALAQNAYPRAAGPVFVLGIMGASLLSALVVRRRTRFDPEDVAGSSDSHSAVRVV